MMKHFFIFLFLYINYNTSADITNNISKSLLYIKYKHDHQNPIPDIPLECTRILHDFADYSSNVTKCSIEHATPVNLCIKCVNHYVNFTKKYDELLKTNVNGTKCKSFFISHDRLDVVLEYHDSILNVWNKGHCNDCFDWGQNKPEISNNTKTFKLKHNETMSCIDQYLNGTASNTEEVCQKCYLTYVELDEFYKTLSKDSIGVDSVCMDIVDSMNATRYIWSKLLNCCHFRRSPEIIFLCCTGIIASLPILFYVAVRYCGPIKDLPNVLKQSRFKEMIMRSSDRAIN